MELKNYIKCEKLKAFLKVATVSSQNFEYSGQRLLLAFTLLSKQKPKSPNGSLILSVCIDLWCARDGGGVFFLACWDFGVMCDHSFPAFA